MIAVDVSRDGERLEEDLGHDHGAAEVEHDTALVQILDPRAWTSLLRGSRGLADGYLNGYWDSPDLTAVIRVGARNSGAFDELARRLAAVRVPYQRPGSAPAPRPRCTNTVGRCGRWGWCCSLKPRRHCLPAHAVW